MNFDSKKDRISDADTIDLRFGWLGKQMVSHQRNHPMKESHFFYGHYPIEKYQCIFTSMLISLGFNLLLFIGFVVFYVANVY